MKKFVILKVECYTLEGMEVSKYDDEKASEEHVVFKDSYIDFNDVVAIRPGIRHTHKSVVTMSSGDDFIVKGTPDQIMAEVEAQYAQFEY